MTQENPPPIDVRDVWAHYLGHRLRNAQLNPGNKDRLMALLAAAGISSVIVEFDGGGDSGQIETIRCLAGEAEVAIPDATLEIQSADYTSGQPVTAMQSTEEAIEWLCYALLEAEYGGWENNEGGFGTFTFKVAERAISLEFYSRFVDSIGHSHEY